MSTKSEMARIKANKTKECSKKKTNVRVEGVKGNTKEFIVNINKEMELLIQADKNRYVNVRELQDNLIDLISIKTEFQYEEKIELSRITDTFMDLVYKGQRLVNNRLTNIFSIV